MGFVFFPQGTFASYLNHLCPYFTMLQDFQSFGEELNCSREVANCIKFPPNTYIAYWTVVKEFLNDFNALITQIETKVKKQGMCFKVNAVFMHVILSIAQMSHPLSEQEIKYRVLHHMVVSHLL
jgi:hypothetical protein